jgi:hypothetical protein
MQSSDQSSPQPQGSKQDQPTLVKRISEHPIVLLLGMIATLAVLVGIVYDALRDPEISGDPIVDPSRPFAFPFGVKNESWLFDMRDTSMICHIDKIRWSGGGGIENLNIEDVARATLAPGDTGIFKCSIQLRGEKSSGFELVSGHIIISVTYTTMWLIARASPGTEFTWFANGSPPHWVRGTLAK